MKKFSVIILVCVMLLSSCNTATTPLPLPTDIVLPVSTFTPEPTSTLQPSNSLATPTSQSLSQLQPLSLSEFDARYSTGDIALSKDGKFMSVVSKDKLENNKTVWVWSVNDLNQSLAGYQVVLDDLWSVAFSPDVSQLAIGGKGKIIIVDWRTGNITDTIELPDSEAVQLEFVQDKILVSSNFKDKITVWDLSRGEVKYSVDGRVGFYQHSFAISPDGKTLVTGDLKGIQFWDMATGQNTGFREGTDSGIGVAPATVFSDNGTFLASTGCGEFAFEGCSSAKILIWKSDSNTPSVVSGVHPSWINALAFSPNEGILASTSGDGIIKLINLSDGKIITAPSMELPGKLPPENLFLVNDISFLSDENILAVSSSDGIQFFDIASMSWTPNLQFILSLGYSYTITSAGDNLNFRREPSMNGEIINKLHTGDWFGIIDGPKIVDDYVWWKVKIADDTEGWIVEQPGWYEFNP